MALALAIIGDIIPPRERGRYQGYFAAVFGTSPACSARCSAASSPTAPAGSGSSSSTCRSAWSRWWSPRAALKMPHVRREHTIDYLGAAVVVGSRHRRSCSTPPGPAPTTAGPPAPALGLLVAGVVLAVAFVLVELRAAEPIIPMRLFRNSIFSIANLFGFLIGIAMFGVDDLHPGLPAGGRRA